MGDTGQGMTECRRMTIEINLINQLYNKPLFDLMFLQEVWSEKFLKGICKPESGLAFQQKNEYDSPAQGRDCINCILYQGNKLEVLNWADVLKERKNVGVSDSLLRDLNKKKDDLEKGPYGGRLCIVNFRMKGCNNAVFVAMSLHAPSKSPIERMKCLVGVRDFANVVVAAGLPVLIGGDFNASINWWQLDGYQGLLYWPRRRYELIDFIALKAPTNLCKLRSVTAAEIKYIYVYEREMFQKITNHDPLTTEFTFLWPSAAGHQEHNVTEQMKSLAI